MGVKQKTMGRKLAREVKQTGVKQGLFQFINGIDVMPVCIILVADSWYPVWDVSVSDTQGDVFKMWTTSVTKSERVGNVDVLTEAWLRILGPLEQRFSNFFWRTTVTIHTMYAYHCHNTNYVRVPLSQYRTCTRTTVTIQNMYAYHCHNTEHVRVPLS